MTDLNNQPCTAKATNLSPMMIDDVNSTEKINEPPLLASSRSAHCMKQCTLGHKKKITTKHTRKMALNSLYDLRLRKLNLSGDATTIPDTNAALQRATDMQYETQDENFGFPMPRRTRRVLRRNSFVIHRNRNQASWIPGSLLPAFERPSSDLASSDRSTEEVESSLRVIREIMANYATEHDSLIEGERGSLGDRMRRLRLDS